jgi:GNAT superfamily N-acetyltransferase
LAKVSDMYSIRRATLDDVDAIRSIAEKAWLTGHLNSREQVYAVEEIRSLLAGNVQFFLLIEDTLQPVGFISWSVEPAAFVIHQTYCLPSTQGKGYVSALINEVARIAALEGKKEVDLKINTVYVNSKYYNSLGFELVSCKLASSQGKILPEYLFRKIIQ